MSTIHTGGVEGQSDVAVVIDGDQSARAAESRDFVEHHLRCLLQFHSAIFHQRRDVVRDNGTNKVFTVAGAETAQVALFAYVPPPMMGESPTRPAFLFVVPPVEVAAARLPFLSSATAPTVHVDLDR